MRGKARDGDLYSIEIDIKSAERDDDDDEGEDLDFHVDANGEPSDTDDEPTTSKRRRSFGPYKAWSELTRRRKRQITENIYQDIKTLAESNNISGREMADFLLSRFPQPTERNEPSSSQISPPTATALMIESGLGRAKYSQQRKMLKNVGCDVLPSYYKVDEFTRSIVPVCKDIYKEETVDNGDGLPKQIFCGVYYSFLTSVEITLKQIFKAIDLDTSQNINLIAEMKYGWDGSGGHKIYHQLNQRETENLILAMFCILQIKDINNIVIFKQLAPNSEFSQRPLLILLGKETVENVDNLKVLEGDRKLMEEGLLIGNVKVKVKTIAHCLDRKAANLFSGLGGSFCDVCTCSKADSTNIVLIIIGFPINRSVENVRQIYDMLVDENGDVLRKNNDYDVRQGVTSCPVTEIEAPSIQVVHKCLRGFDTYTKCCIRLTAGVPLWSDELNSTYTAAIKNAKEKIQSDLIEESGVRWDFVNSSGGTTTTGNVVRRILFDPKLRAIFTRNISSETARQAAEKFGHDLALILRQLSCGRSLKVEKFRELCTSLYLHLVTDLPWVSITPTLHKLLAHSAELIQLNGGFGLKDLSEEGIEANNKRLREFRTKLSRKISQKDNLVDCLKRLWVGSDPIVAVERQRGRANCTLCNEPGHSYQTCKGGQRGTTDEDLELETFMN